MPICNPQDCLTLQHDLAMVNRFCDDNGLKINESKCKHMSYTIRKQPIQFIYKVNNSEIETIKEIKDLGIIFTNDLKFKNHITNLTMQCFRKLGLVLRNWKTCIILFYSLIRSQLEYGAVLWDPSEVVYTEMIEKIQKKFLRNIYFKKHGVYQFYPVLISYNTQLRDFGMITLEQRRKNARVLFIHDIFHNKLNTPELLSNIPITVPHVRLRREYLFKIGEGASPLQLSLKEYNKVTAVKDLDFFTISRKKLLTQLN